MKDGYIKNVSGIQLPSEYNRNKPVKNTNTVFSSRSYVCFSPSGLQRIYTTLSPNKIMLTAENQSLKDWTQEGVLMGLTVDDSPNITIGSLLLGLGIPLFGMVTGLQVCPSPLDSNILRVILYYHPLPKPNIEKVGVGD